LFSLLNWESDISSQFLRSRRNCPLVTDLATRGRNLQMGHREPTNLQGLESRAQGGTRGMENSLLQTVTPYTVFDEVTVSATPAPAFILPAP